LAGAYNITVKLTRSTDVLVGNAADLREDLLNRVAMAEKSKADLFISIHVNASYSKSTDSTGFEAYVSHRRENIKDKQLASTLLTNLQGIYSTSDIIKEREVGVVVIDKTSCPAVLLECGYITNPRDAAFITNPANQENIARKILEGIVQYSNAQTGHVSGATANKSSGTEVIDIALTEQKNHPSTEVIDIKLFDADTISAEALSKLNPDEIKSLNVDLPRDLVTINFKNGSTKYARAKQVNTYYSDHHIDGELKGYRTNVNMKDSVADIIFTKDTVPGSKKDKGIIFTKVEVEADYPGGPQGWIKYLTSHLHYPDAAVKKNIQGTVLMEFIVNTDGTIADVKAISGPELLKAQSIKAIKESGVWIPAQQNGKKVRAYKRQPITYKLA